MAFDDWLKSDKTESEVFLEELYDDASTVEVYRIVNSDSAAGFDFEASNESKVKSINVRIEESKPPTIYGYTDDTDVLENDHWKYANVNGKVRWYTVKTVISYDYGTEVELIAGEEIMPATVTGISDIQDRLTAFITTERDRVAAAMELISAQNSNDAKQNRPWTDRTGNARRSITGSNAIDGTLYTSALAIGVDYGKYLELSFGGRFAIVWATMTKQRQNMLVTLAKVAGV